MCSKNVAAILVTYNPDVDLLKKVINSIKDQVALVVLVDNSFNCKVMHYIDQKNVKYIFNDGNVGVSGAYNIGINEIKSRFYEFILILDQDTIIPNGMVEEYISVSEILKEKNIIYSAIGPRFKNPRTGRVSKFVRFGWFRNKYVTAEDNQSIVSTDFLISSGSFYRVDVFDQVGYFDEGLFVDHVDTEWFLRAKSLGLPAFGAWKVVMEHYLGEREICLWLLRWRCQPIHKPFRLYYIYRNSLLLYQMPHVKLMWISGDLLRLFRIFFMYLVFCREKIDILHFIRQGLVHGIRGISGPYHGLH